MEKNLQCSSSFTRNYILWDNISSRDQRNIRLKVWWPNIIRHHLVEFGSHALCRNRSHHPVKFTGHRPQGRRIQTFFIYHVTSRDHVIERTCDFVVYGSLSWATILSSLVVTNQMEMKFNIFYLSCQLMCPRDQRVMWLCG